MILKIHIIQSVQSEGPYDLGGYSLGGILAYEVTRQLQELGQPVETIVMLDAMYGNEYLETLSQKTHLSTKNDMLGTINIALISTIHQEPEKIAQTLIHRDELDANMDDEAFLKQLIGHAKTREITKTEKQLRAQIKHNVKVQTSYDVGHYPFLPLQRPRAVTCYYFQNMSGLFYGELAPYFKIGGDINTIDFKNYWEGWEKQLPNFQVTDVDSPNHLMLLSESKSREKILSFCTNLYAENAN